MNLMEMVEYLQKYELDLTRKLLDVAKDMRCGSGVLYDSEDLDGVWDRIVPEYMVDAVPNVAQYPLVAIAWAGYIGMALAHLWDKDWSVVTGADDAYALLRSPRGFDEMDEYIVEEIMGYRLESDTAKRLEDLMRALAETALAQIRHEEIEPQSKMAFHVFARTVWAVFHVGASCELYRLGYKWEKRTV